jgi:uncharacterized membrane protein
MARRSGMERVEKSVDVGVPVRVAYDQWTQFEEFPRFMQGVESVTQTTGETVHWVAEIAGGARSGTRTSPSSSRTA